MDHRAVSPHFRFDHDTVTMDSLVVASLIVVVMYRSEVYCDASPTFAGVDNVEDTGFAGRNDSHPRFDEGSVWRSLGLPQSAPTRESMDSEANGRKSRFLGSLPFLIGLSFAGLAGAASSTAKNIAKLPPTSISLNLGSSKASPYLAAYYNPYSLLPYPLFYPGFGLLPTMGSTKPQTKPQNDLTPQVISVFDNRDSVDYADNNEEYVDDENKSSNGKRRNDERRNGFDEQEEWGDGNAERKTVTTRGCKGGQRKHVSFFGGSAREREDPRVDVDDLRATLGFRAANQTATESTTATATTNSTKAYVPTENTTHHHHHYYYAHNFTTRPSLPGYLGGYPQNVNDVDLTTGSDPYRHHDYIGPINYDLPYEQPANFYQNDKYNVYASPHVNAHFAGPHFSDRANDYVSPGVDRLYSEYRPPYADGFKPSLK